MSILFESKEEKRRRIYRNAFPGAFPKKDEEIKTQQKTIRDVLYDIDNAAYNVSGVLYSLFYGIPCTLAAVPIGLLADIYNKLKGDQS